MVDFTEDMFDETPEEPAPESKPVRKRRKRRAKTPLEERRKRRNPTIRRMVRSIYTCAPKGHILSNKYDVKLLLTSAWKGGTNKACAMISGVPLYKISGWLAKYKQWQESDGQTEILKCERLFCEYFRKCQAYLDYKCDAIILDAVANGDVKTALHLRGQRRGAKPSNQPTGDMTVNVHIERIANMPAAGVFGLIKQQMDTLGLTYDQLGLPERTDDRSSAS